MFGKRADQHDAIGGNRHGEKVQPQRHTADPLQPQHHRNAPQQVLHPDEPYAVLVASEVA